MRALVVGVSGAAVTVGALRAARRTDVRSRLPRRGGSGRLPESVRAPVGRALERAGATVVPEDALLGWAAAVLVAVGAALLAGAGPVGAVVATTGAVAAPALGLRLGRIRQERLQAASVPTLVDRLAAEVRAGATVVGAIANVAETDAPLAPDLRRIEARTRLGVPLAEALAEWPVRRAVPGIDAVAGALAMCATVGGRSAEALDGLAAACRDRLAVAAESRALAAQARASAVLVGGAPVAVLAWSAVTGGSAVAALFSTPTGWVCLGVGGALEVLGAWWMHRIIRSGRIA